MARRWSFTGLGRFGRRDAGLSTGFANSTLAELAWQRSSEGFQLSLQGQALGAAFIGWASPGGFDEAGLEFRPHLVIRLGDRRSEHSHDAIPPGAQAIGEP